jgi:hypothetical protein
VAAVLDPKSLGFVDEMGVHTSLALLYGYAPKGEGLCLLLPCNRGKNTTLLSSMTLSGMGPSMALEDSTTAAVFEASSSTLDTVWRVNNCETCCSPALARWRGRDEHRDSVMYCVSLGTH